MWVWTKNSSDRHGKYGSLIKRVSPIDNDWIIILMIDDISYDDLDGRRGRRQETRVLDLIKIGRLFIKIIVLLGFLHHPLDSHGRGAVEN